MCPTLPLVRLTAVIISRLQWHHSMSAAEVTKASSSTAEVPSGREHTLRPEPEHITEKQVQLT